MLDEAIKHYETGNLEECDRALRDCLKKKTNVPEALYYLGLIAISQNDIRSARARFSGSLELDPMNANAHYYLGHVELRRGNLGEAVRRFALALAANPGHRSAHAAMHRLTAPRRSEVKPRKGRARPKRAREQRKQAEPSAPNQRLWEPVRPLYEAGRYEEAAKMGRKIIETRASPAYVFYNTACCESLAGRTRDAIKHLTSAIELSESYRTSAREEPDFDPIRRESRFEKLIGA